MRSIYGITFCSNAAEILEQTASALLIVDTQNDFCSPGGHFARNGKELARIIETIPNVQGLLAAAREHHRPVVFAQQTTSPGLRSDTPAWLYFKTRDGKSPDYTIDGTWGHQIIPELIVAPGDPVVRKQRPSAFHRTDLDELLRHRGIETLVIAGCITQGCVQATATDASYHDYYVIVASDCVQSTSQEMHENALRFLRSRYDVLPASEIVAGWARRSRRDADAEALAGDVAPA